ncbi:hypothetical protein [Bacillus sp. UNC322MFChir4.1]|uniref:hypothetical protein n=1 Tax=Bacillus sp. UNC322MFChir4.1 TaxID=1449045 RepID=UPI0005568FE3|nr:hypothetical protein [Bacillus sp. UNC322MFChir4.1]
MPEIQAKVNISPGLQNLINHNEEIAPKAIKSGMKLITRQVPKEVRNKIRSLGLVRTGSFAKSIRGKTAKDKSIIGSRYFVGHILEGGAKPHIIKGRKGKKLWFPGLKRPVRKVRHPGIKAYKYLEGTVNDMENSGTIESLFSQGVREALEELQNG